jgi:copper(I)-binding protein
MIFLRNFSWMALCVAMVLNACAPVTEQSGPVFEDAWIRPLPPGMKMTAAFGTLSTPGKKPLVFNSFSSPSFGDVSLHRTREVDGVSKMREVDELRVAPGESVVLEPGGYHLMLMVPGSDLEPGQTVHIVMSTDDGNSYGFDVPVERR